MASTLSMSSIALGLAELFRVYQSPNWMASMVGCFYGCFHLYAHYLIGLASTSLNTLPSCALHVP